MYVCGFFPKETIPSGVELVEVIALNTTTARHHGTFYCYLVKKKEIIVKVVKQMHV